MKTYKMGVLGAGNMGTAIAEGAVRAGMMQAGEILMFNRTAEKRAEKAARGFAVTDAYQDVYTGCEWVVLGVKPQNFDEILPALAAAGADPKPLVISIAAGVTFGKIGRALGADCPVVRVMPNTPLMLGCGASALVKNGAATAAQLEAVTALFGAMGTTAVFDREEMLNEVIPYNGSLPAFAYQFIEAFARSAETHGIARADALALICQTLAGSAKMVMQGDKSPQELIAAVCSPGGTTIEGVRVFEARGLDAIVAEASDKAIARAYELGK
ncbi:pyrroline-5-carboxylate reductase [Intestinibacillus massiliensis]|nr:pyrroline-5-carboxylate reductase [Intestinibacillus massiliensis]